MVDIYAKGLPSAASESLIRLTYHLRLKKYKCFPEILVKLVPILYKKQVFSL